MSLWFRRILIVLVLAAGFHAATIYALPSGIVALFTARSAGRLGINRAATQSLPTDQSRSVVRPSPDLLYAVCLYDVTSHPLLLEAICRTITGSLSLFASIPTISLPSIDHQVESRHPRYLLARDAKPAGLPTDLAGLPVIVAPSPTGVVLFRNLVLDAAAADTAQAAQQSARCTSFRPRPPKAEHPDEAWAPTFSVFVDHSAPMPFAPATTRAFLCFLDASNVARGATSVALTNGATVTTAPASMKAMSRSAAAPPLASRNPRSSLSPRPANSRGVTVASFTAPVDALYTSTLAVNTSLGVSGARNLIAPPGTPVPDGPSTSAMTIAGTVVPRQLHRRPVHSRFRDGPHHRQLEFTRLVERDQDIPDRGGWQPHRHRDEQRRLPVFRPGDDPRHQLQRDVGDR